jgi:hypothetical protein
MRRLWIQSLMITAISMLTLLLCAASALALVGLAAIEPPPDPQERHRYAYECARLPTHATLPLNLRSLTLWARGYVLALKHTAWSSSAFASTVKALPARAALKVDELIITECRVLQEQN